MQTHLVLNGNSKDLLIFALGWGMDHRPMMPVVGKRNILFLFDYRDLSLNFDFSKFERFTLAAFSCGVFVMPFIKGMMPPVSHSTAFCGVPDLFDPERGLARETVEAFRGITADNFMDFRRDYLTDTPEALEKFNKHPPACSIEDSLAELDALEALAGTFPESPYVFDRAVIAKNDRIIPPEKQKKAWEGIKSEVVDAGHFLFYNYGDLNYFFD